MSQRTADELEFRRGMVLGLTLAEVLLLLLFVLILALTWRFITVRDTLVEEQKRSAGLSGQLTQLTAALDPLGPLLAKLREENGAFDAATVEQLVLKLAEADRLATENSNLKEENSGLKMTLGSVRLIGADVGKLKSLSDLIAAAAKINPADPPQVLTRAMDVLKAVGPDVKPEQMASLSEIVQESGALHTLDPILAEARRINPSDPPEALKRALAILGKLGPGTQPDQVIPLEEQKSLAGQLAHTRQERDNLMHSGNGLTYPSCWTTPAGQTEYMFDVTIQDDGLIVRDATPGRANDPAMQLVSGLPRNTVIREVIFTNGTNELYKSSVQQNCRFYSIIRDQTGPTSKQRYKTLRTIIENHFYPLLKSDPWVARANPPPGAPGIGGPFVPAR